MDVSKAASLYALLKPGAKRMELKTYCSYPRCKYKTRPRVLFFIKQTNLHLIISRYIRHHFIIILVQFGYRYVRINCTKNLNDVCYRVGRCERV